MSSPNNLQTPGKPDAGRHETQTEEATMSFTDREFRDALGQFATGVCVVTAESTTRCCVIDIPGRPVQLHSTTNDRRVRAGQAVAAGFVSEDRRTAQSVPIRLPRPANIFHLRRQREHALGTSSQALGIVSLRPCLSPMRGWEQCNHEETCANLLFLHVPLLMLLGISMGAIVIKRRR